MPSRCPTCTRTSSARESSRARESTRWTRSSRRLADRVPENTQLSHDLFEGLFARAGFVSDIEVFEGFPGHYEVAVSRQHRWVRGDWQLLPWVLAPALASPGPRAATAIPAIGRWKMFDNLRRSLVGPGDLRDAAGRLVSAGGQRRSVDGLRDRRPRPSDAAFVLLEPLPEATRDRQAELPARSGQRSRDRPGAGRAPDRLPGACGVDAVRRDRAHAVAPGGLATPPSGMGARGAGAPHARSRNGRLLSADARRDPAGRGGGRPRRRFELGRPGLGRAVSRGLAPLAPRRALDQPASSRRRVRPSLAGGGACAARDRPPHLALLRAVRRTAVSRAAGRQFPGGAAAGDRAAHLADQCRARPALDGCGQRLRLDRNDRDGRALRGGPGRDRPHANASAGTSTTGMERTISRRSSRGTSPRSTAATWPRTC